MNDTRKKPKNPFGDINQHIFGLYCNQVDSFIIVFKKHTSGDDTHYAVCEIAKCLNMEFDGSPHNHINVFFSNHCTACCLFKDLSTNELYHIMNAYDELKKS